MAFFVMQRAARREHSVTGLLDLVRSDSRKIISRLQPGYRQSAGLDAERAAACDGTPGLLTY